MILSVKPEDSDGQNVLRKRTVVSGQCVLHNIIIAYKLFRESLVEVFQLYQSWKY